MILRLEIPKRTKLAVFKRAGGPGALRCEGECGLPLKGKRFEYHHEHAEWMQNVPRSEREAITPEEVKLLCIPCHAAISAKDTTVRAHCNRIVEKTAKVKKSNPLPGSKASGWRHRMDGTWEKR